ncbi:hypothetical protein C8Q74DRAFT_1257381 [Fomes fomentarius]|nr:hypothetical protein C8Q74DRAFT_1257381 [Fomes fomentarius]
MTVTFVIIITWHSTSIFSTAPPCIQPQAPASESQRRRHKDDNWIIIDPLRSLLCVATLTNPLSLSQILTPHRRHPTPIPRSESITAQLADNCSGPLFQHPEATSIRL